MRTATVSVYLALAAIALVPGLLLAFMPEIETGHASADRWLGMLRRILVDIHFGGGIRFWLGITGATMMALLLLYPLRKALARRRFAGSVGGWFHLHMIFGIAGPVLILYHSNFGHGAPDANVALWAMLAVASSGIIGHFIYASVSADFYANKQIARAHLDAISSTLIGLDAMHSSREALQADLDAFDAALLTPRSGLRASLMARMRMERRRSELAKKIAWHLSSCGEQLTMADAERARLRSFVGQHFGAYMRSARRGASRSVREQVWARWRLFHMPAFLIMLIAMGLHIKTVWTFDGMSAAAIPAATGVAFEGATFPDATDAGAAGTASASAPRAVRGMPVRRITTVPHNGEVGASQSPILITPPTIAKRPPATSASAAQSVAPAAAVRVPDKTTERQAETPRAADIPSPLMPSTSAAATDKAGDAIADLQKRFDDPSMALGAKPRTLVEQIAALKLKQKNKQFAHSAAETGFALTGQHTKIECASCHTTMVGEPVVASDNPRACVNCHKKDDVHRGRRQMCASCHTTKSWGELIRE